MSAKMRPAKRAAKARRQVHWEILVLPWIILLGGLIGLGAEPYLHINNILFPLGTAFLGGMAGAVCDTALYVYRKHRRDRNKITVSR